MIRKEKRQLSREREERQNVRIHCDDRGGANSSTMLSEMLLIMLRRRDLLPDSQEFLKREDVANPLQILLTYRGYCHNLRQDLFFQRKTHGPANDFLGIACQEKSRIVGPDQSFRSLLIQ